MELLVFNDSRRKFVSREFGFHATMPQPWETGMQGI